jgi:hypothetical protein
MALLPVRMLEALIRVSVKASVPKRKFYLLCVKLVNFVVHYFAPSVHNGQD